MKSLSVIVPCYNDEKSVLSFESVFANDKWVEIQKKYIIEIIFVNDGSKDETLKSIMYLVEKYNFVKFLNLDKNQGKDFALSSGYNVARMDFVTNINSDSNYLLYEMGRFLDETKLNNCVCGNRVGRLLINKFMSFINRLVVACLFYKCKSIKDVGGQPIILSTDFYNKYIKDSIFLFLDKFNFNILLFMKILKNNLEIKWIDVDILPREFDESKGSEGFKNSIFLSIKLIKMYIKLKIKLRKYSKLENKEDL